MAVVFFSRSGPLPTHRRPYHNWTRSQHNIMFFTVHCYLDGHLWPHPLHLPLWKQLFGLLVKSEETMVTRGTDRWLGSKFRALWNLLWGHKVTMTTDPFIYYHMSSDGYTCKARGDRKWSYMFQNVPASFFDKLISLNVLTNIFIHVLCCLLKKLQHKQHVKILMSEELKKKPTNTHCNPLMWPLTFWYFLNTAMMSSLKLGWSTALSRSMDTWGSV